VLFLLVGVAVAGVRSVPGGNVGVYVNNLTGSVQLEMREGLHFTIPYVMSFYVLDRTNKTLEMLATPDPSRGKGAEDPLMVKSSEGDNVTIDVKVLYHIVAEKAVDVLRTTGAGSLAANGVEAKWVRPLMRAAVLDSFNLLTREEMNDGKKREDKAEASKKFVNEQLMPFGIEVLQVTVERPSSYRQYEDIVDQRKRTDQRVEGLKKEQEQAREAQKSDVKREEYVRDTSVSKLTAEAERRILENKQKAASTITTAQTTADKTRREAESTYSLSHASAEVRRKVGEAEAEGMRKESEALVGDSGAALVAAEYLKKLKDIRVTAIPWYYNAAIQPYLMQSGSDQGIGLPKPSVGSPVAPTAPAVK